MDLGHDGMESQAALQSHVCTGPNSGCRVPQNIRDSPKTRDSGCKDAQKLKKRLAPEPLASISAPSVRCLPFSIFRGRVNSDRLLEITCLDRSRNSRSASEMRIDRVCC